MPRRPLRGCGDHFVGPGAIGDGQSDLLRSVDGGKGPLVVMDHFRKPHDEPKSMRRPNATIGSRGCSSFLARRRQSIIDPFSSVSRWGISMPRANGAQPCCHTNDAAGMPAELLSAWEG